MFRMQFARLARLSPWWWIASIFFAQTLGSIAVTLWFRLGIRETAVPIAILVFGVGFSALVARWSPPEARVRWLRCVPMLLYALFIYALSSRSYPGARVAVSTDLFHLVEFATLGFLLACCWYPLLRRSGARLFIAAVVGSGLLYALSDELHQSFVPGRTATVVDLAYDISALAASCALFLAAVHLRVQLQRASRAGNG